MRPGVICSVLLGLLVFVSSLQTPTSFSARFTAIPRQNPAIKYQGIVNANKNQTWSIEAITRDERTDTTYLHSEKQTILVRGNPSSTCTKQLVNGPPIVQHLERVFDAQPVKTDIVYDSQVQNCLDEKLSIHAFEFEGETFVFCAKDMVTFEIKRVVGRDIVIEIEDFQFGANSVITKVAQTFDRVCLNFCKLIFYSAEKSKVR
jgi:deoxycytidylate deaminase